MMLKTYEYCLIKPYAISRDTVLWKTCLQLIHQLLLLKLLHVPTLSLLLIVQRSRAEDHFAIMISFLTCVLLVIGICVEKVSIILELNSVYII